METHPGSPANTSQTEGLRCYSWCASNHYFNWYRPFIWHVNLSDTDSQLQQTTWVSPVLDTHLLQYTVDVVDSDPAILKIKFILAIFLTTPATITQLRKRDQGIRDTLSLPGATCSSEISVWM